MTSVIRNWFHGAPLPDNRWQQRADPRAGIHQLGGRQAHCFGTFATPGGNAKSCRGAGPIDYASVPISGIVEPGIYGRRFH